MASLKSKLLMAILVIGSMQSVHAAIVQAQDPLNYTWQGDCSGSAGVAGECSGVANASFVVDQYTAIDGIITPESLSSFSYFDNDPLFTNMFGFESYTWDLSSSSFDNTSWYSINGSLPAPDTSGFASSEFVLSFISDVEEFTFSSATDGTWSFAIVKGFDMAAGFGNNGTFNKVPEPAITTLFLLGLASLAFISRRRHQLKESG